jgi:hypothetical protein
MSVVIRDQTRTFPLQKVPLINGAYSDLYQYMVTLKRAVCENWTDESPSDVGMQLLHLFTVLAQYIVDSAELAKNNTFLGTTTDREAMRQICALIGYTLGEGTPASVTMTFTNEAGHPGFTIPKGTQVATAEDSDNDAIIYEVGADVVVAAGVTSTEVVCSQGETVYDEILGSSVGTARQTFRLAGSSVIRHSEIVTVYNGLVETIWTLVSDFTESAPTDTHYRVETDSEGRYQIIFGDGINGAIPPMQRDSIKATYRTGSGTVGNVGAGYITEILSTVQYVEAVENLSEASGGTNEETIEHARIFAPASIRTLERAVTLADIETLCEAFTSTTYGGIAQARAHTVGSYLAQVSIVPRSGGVPHAGLRTEINTYLAARAMVGTTIEATAPNYFEVDITASLSVLPSYNLDAVVADVQARLVRYLSPTYQDPATGLYPHEFGRNIYISDVYGVIRNTPGVDFCQVILPTADVLVESYQIAVPGTITINPSGDVQSPPFHDSRYSPPPTIADDKYGATREA